MIFIISQSDKCHIRDKYHFPFVAQATIHIFILQYY